jgi:hypothetical protein
MDGAWTIGAMILTDESQNTWRNSSPSATLYTTYPTLTYLVSKPGLRVDMSAPDLRSNRTTRFISFLKCWVTGWPMVWSKVKKAWPVLSSICLRIKLHICQIEIRMQGEGLLTVISGNLGFLFHLNPKESLKCCDNYWHKKQDNLNAVTNDWKPTSNA